MFLIFEYAHSINRHQTIIRGSLYQIKQTKQMHFSSNNVQKSTRLDHLLATAESNPLSIASHEEVILTGPLVNFKTRIKAKQEAFASTVIVLRRVQLGICHHTKNL